MLKLTNIKKAFGSHAVFSIDGLELPKGIYWLKGINGSGKSTLLKLMAGLLPFKGNIAINSAIDIRKSPVMYRSLINYAEAEPLFPSFLTGKELIHFVKKVKAGTEEQLTEAKAFLGMDDYLLNPAGSYSSGMLKKVSLAMAFMGKPEWILLDEPFTTLDAATQTSLCRLISRKRTEGISFILTSHHDVDIADIRFDGAFLLQNKSLQPTAI
jgi:ABC-2 type transport system ATP-binding protein